MKITNSVEYVSQYAEQSEDYPTKSDIPEVLSLYVPALKEDDLQHFRQNGGGEKIGCEWKCES